MKRIRPRPRSLLALSLAIVVFAAGCGSSSSSSGASQTQTTTHLATAKFVLHAGLALGAFHRYIYKPLRSGALTGNPLRHKAALLKAGLAGLFAYHEIKLALVDARASPLLSRLLAPLSALGAKLSSLGTRLRGGHVDPTAISSANGDAGALSSSAAASGQPITEKIPSAAQLASGG